MSDLGDSYREMRERGKLHRKEREIINTHAINKWCIENNVICKEIETYQIRIYTDKLTLDIFPQSKKYHNITANERGLIKGKIIDFLKLSFEK